MTLTPGTRLGPYEILSPLGAGGMGEVYRARDSRLDRDVAVKVLPERLADDPAALARFEREAKAVAALSHPNILAIHDFNRDGGISYVVMELLEGESVADRLLSGPIPWRTAAEISMGIAEGLSAAHAKGIVHRDLKPQNLFLTREGRAKILDFGLARRESSPPTQSGTQALTEEGTTPGTVLGTVGYMRYRKTTKSLPEISKELGVDAVVEGSVSRNGSQVKVTAQLIDASKDKHLWADSFQRDLKDVLALQGEVARAIAQEVRAKLTPEEATHLAASRQVDPEAYEAYLQGRYFLYRRTSADLLKARDYFEKAISKDPEYALAYAGLADAYGLLGSASYSTLPPSETVPKVEAAVRKALELDPMLAEAHAGLAHISRDSATAEREFRRAIELDPKYAMGRQFYARFLVAHGRFDEAIREVKIGRDLDPLSLVGNTNVGFVLHFARRDDEAIEWCRKSLSMDPNFLLARWTLGMAYEQKKMYPEAIAEFEKARSLSKDGPAHVAALGHAYAVAGRVADARRCLEAMTDGPSYRQVVDLSRLAASRFVHTTGQSGNVFAPGYRDLLPEWRAGRNFEIEGQAAVRTLILEP